MADLVPHPLPQRQRRRRKQTTNNEIVEINVEPQNAGTVNATRLPNTRRRQRRQRRKINGLPVFGPWLPRRPRPATRLRRAIKREIKKEGLEGPKVSVQQRVSSTFGLVGPNKSGNVELELNFFLHPSLAKEANDGTSFGPVQALAAQYALWKLKYLRLTFTPMVGASAVSGTVVRASLNLSQSPGGTNWSGLGTRQHIDMHPGQTAVFHLRGDQIGGPRDGGWWLTDTNEEGSQSAGPIIEVHTLGKTESTFQAKDWESPLFIVEGVGIWQFANYQVKPALGMLERRQETVDTKISADAGSPLVMELPLDATVTKFMMDMEPETRATPATNSVGETIFQIVDVGADLARKYAPPPFGWLISGGWWFLKRVFGRNTRDNTASFYVYASLADAQNNKPAIAGPTAQTQSGTVRADIIVTQMNAPNVGPQPTTVAQGRAAVPVPLEEGVFRIHSEMYPMEFVEWSGAGGAFPSSFIVGSLKDGSVSGKKYLKTAWYVTNQKIYATQPDQPSRSGSFLHTVYKLINPRFTDKTGNLEYIPPEPQSGAFVYFGNPSSEATYQYLGDVVATGAITGEKAYLQMVLTLFKAKIQRPESVESNDVSLYRANQGGSTGSQRAMVSFKKVTVSDNPNVRMLSIQQDDYFLGVSFAGGTSAPSNVIQTLTGTNVEVSTSFLFTSAEITDSFFRLDSVAGHPILKPFAVPYGLSGNLFATFSADLNMVYAKPTSVTELLSQLRELNVQFSPERVEAITSSESDTDSDSDVEPYTEAIKEYLTVLLNDGRLPNRAEIHYRAGDYHLAYQVYKES
nr:MAG: capsid protein precursor [Bat astrovirus]